MSPLESRLVRLERQNRTLRAAWVLSAIALLNCGGITSNYERVNTNTLVIVDESEAPVITMAANGTITFHGPTPAVLDAETLAKLIAASSAPAP
ncbi:MAG: hypothetical protein HC927_05595 [Deltaproteobacteria bacterium]|nr:hypothetical protein [Deltaproteobacteria bacterium]